MATTIIFPVGRGHSSTGRDSINDPADVRAVQDLLNEVPSAQGGPSSPLDVNGKVDDATNAAIRRFQQRQLGWADGVVDPREKTLRRLNELAGTPLPRLDNSLPPPPMVAQHDEYLCWAAALESWLDVTAGREQVSQDDLVDQFSAVEDPDTGAMTGPGWAAIGVRFQMEGKRFQVAGGWFLGPNDLTSEFISDKLTNKGHLLFIYSLVPGGPSHVNVVYAVFEQNNQPFVKAMDPYTRGNGGMVTRPLSFYTRRGAVSVLWAADATP